MHADPSSQAGAPPTEAQGIQGLRTRLSVARQGIAEQWPERVQVDVKYLPQRADEISRRSLVVAIDRATRWVFIRVFKSKTAANARRFLRDLERAWPIRIRTVLTDTLLAREQNAV